LISPNGAGMHVEIPKSKTLKEFGGEYLMIVISILTALALEQALEAVHHRHLAHQAAETIEAELHQNVKMVADALTYNEKKRQILEEVRVQLLAGIRDKTPEADLMQRVETEWRPALALDMKRPVLSQEAWETAVANQAVTWMPRDTLQRYAGAYSSVRSVGAIVQGGSMIFLDGPRTRDIWSDVQMGVANPQETYRAANQLVSLYQNVDGNLKALKERMEQAVEDDRAPVKAEPGV
jgi:hypothetical protein